MYIPEFWAGVLSVITGEMIAFIAFIVHALIKGAKEHKGEEANEKTK